MQNPKTKPYNQSARSLAAAISALALASVLAGCGGALSTTSIAGTGSSAIVYTGNVHGGQQPVAGSTIQVYTVGTAGLKSASTPLVAASVKTDVNGNFSLNANFDCTTIPASLVYITATQGDSGAGTNNPAIAMMSALGDCATLLAAGHTFIQINELTTVAAGYALAPFAQDYTHIGAAGTSPAGLVNAFATASTLVNIATGQTPGSTLPAGATEPVVTLNTLADIIAACVNTPSGGSNQCATLFSATGATETIGAILAIAKNPGASTITALYALPSATSPFQPAFSTQPNDFTVAINYNAGGGLSAPYAIALDVSGNAWIANEGGTTVTELSPTGALKVNATAPGLYGPQGVAIDKLGNVWVANTAGNSVIKFSLSGGTVVTTTSFTAGGISAPSAIALDSANNVFVANFNGNSVTGLDANGGPLAGSPFTGNSAISLPGAIAVGQTGGSVYVTSGGGPVIKLSNAGAYTASLGDGVLEGPTGLAFSGAGHLGVIGFTTGSSVGAALSEFDSTGTGAAATVSPVTAGLAMPAGIASDGISFFVANGGPNGSLSQFTYNTPTALSPASGFGSLNAPAGVAVDGSGSVWTANSGSNTVSKFVGLAVPTSTPLSTTVGP